MRRMTLTAVRSQSWSDSPAMPVVLLLHGFGSHEHDLPALAAWLPAHLPWAALRAPLTLGPGQYAWFPLTPTGDMDATAIEEATEAIWAWVDAHVPASSTVIPVGFSQGGCMALELLRTRPERVLAPVMLAGFVSPGEREQDAHLAVEKPEVFWGRGDSDPVIWPPVVARTHAYLDAHADATVQVYPGLAHSVAQEEMDDVKVFLRRMLAAH